MFIKNSLCAFYLFGVGIPNGLTIIKMNRNSTTNFIWNISWILTFQPTSISNKVHRGHQKKKLFCIHQMKSRGAIEISHAKLENTGEIVMSTNKFRIYMNKPKKFQCKKREINWSPCQKKTLNIFLNGSSVPSILNGNTPVAKFLDFRFVRWHYYGGLDNKF